MKHEQITYILIAVLAIAVGWLLYKKYYSKEGMDMKTAHAHVIDIGMKIQAHPAIQHIQHLQNDPDIVKAVEQFNEHLKNNPQDVAKFTQMYKQLLVHFDIQKIIMIIKADLKIIIAIFMALIDNMKLIPHVIRASMAMMQNPGWGMTLKNIIEFNQEMYIDMVKEIVTNPQQGVRNILYMIINLSQMVTQQYQ